MTVTMFIFSFFGFLLVLAGGYSLYQYSMKADPFNFAGNCNPYATASSCDDISIAYLIIGLVCGGIGLVFMLVARMGRGRMAREQRFMQSARPGMARIISVEQPMNATVNNRPLLTFQLDVTIDAAAPYQTKVRTAVAPLTMAQVKLAPGSELPVKVNPANPSDIRIDWAAAVQHQAQAPATTPG